ncbi:TetR family transcriptional regulator [Actinomadura sp. NBRC 104412]|uniref:TetR/AcrR family transcriptional regulator n=1 Tax=Actinomadura sp. NBRC 104412 TaxID=3032203 RepID=UPI0024A1AE50|nr:TetR/AcrR family transcriptional regulator [Actinomadura sp. NBRC 104412]GLZ06199.1 TetR family transcriptional regulator [Actinomadura sp. NBRC 104412]
MAGRGRPRTKGPSLSGSTEQDILDAGADLFCTAGFGSVSTYRLAKAAGISQATLYHYFANKHEVLLALLLQTVRPSIVMAERIAGENGLPARERLRRLCAYDADLLATSPRNLGALYLLPEVADEALSPFRAERDRLVGAYRALVGQCLPDAPEPEHEAVADLVFGLVESVILCRQRAGGAPMPAGTGDRIAEAALRIVGR